MSALAHESDTALVEAYLEQARRFPLGVLAIGGERSYGEHVAEAMRLVADDVQSVVIAGAGHWVAEEAPDALLDALTTFLSPYLAAARPVANV